MAGEASRSQPGNSENAAAPRPGRIEVSRGGPWFTVASVVAVVLWVVVPIAAMAWWAWTDRGLSGLRVGTVALLLWLVPTLFIVRAALRLLLGVRAIEIRTGPDRIILHGGIGRRSVALDEMRYVGLRSSERSVSGEGATSSHIEHVWEIALVCFSGPRKNVREPPEGSPITEWWRYAQAATWLAFTPARKKILGRVASELCRRTGRPCLFQGSDKEPRIVPPDRVLDHWETFGDSRY